MSRWIALAFAVVLGVLGAGCTSVFRAADTSEALVTSRGVMVYGRINYVIDGQSVLPYGAFKPAVPAPFINALRLEAGDSWQSMTVDKGDGSFLWRVPPGHYIVSGIGPGQLWDDYRITWPRIAFHVPAEGGPVYLGHLQLRGTRYAETSTLSTGKTVSTSGVRYAFVVEDAEAEDQGILARRGTIAGGAPTKSLMFQRDAMPIGQGLQEAWQRSREQLIADIFGAGGS
jgi:hypothetical protein